MGTCTYNCIEEGWLLIDKQDRELLWLLEALKETLTSLEEGVEECQTLLKPAETGSTLVVSTPWSDGIKGYITRSGANLVRGSISVNLPTLPSSPSTHTITSTYPISSLIAISSLLSDSRLLIQTIQSTSPGSSSASSSTSISTASFLRDQFHLLSDLLATITATLTGTGDPDPRFAEKLPLTPSTLPPLFIRYPTGQDRNLSPTVLPPTLFEPPLPPQLALTLALASTADGGGSDYARGESYRPGYANAQGGAGGAGRPGSSSGGNQLRPASKAGKPIRPTTSGGSGSGSGSNKNNNNNNNVDLFRSTSRESHVSDHAADSAPSFALTARTLGPADAPAMSLRERLGLGAQVVRHDESGADVLYGERQVRVREKVRVNVGDPGLVSLASKVGAMERVVAGARGRLEAVVEAREMVR